MEQILYVSLSVYALMSIAYLIGRGIEPRSAWDGDINYLLEFIKALAMPIVIIIGCLGICIFWPISKICSGISYVFISIGKWFIQPF